MPILGVNPRVQNVIEAIIGSGEEPADEQDGQDPRGAILELQRLKAAEGAVILIVGAIETGKTVLALKLAQYLESPTLMVTPFEKPPSWIKKVEFDHVTKWITEKDYYHLPPGCVLVLDDLPAYASIRKLGTTEMNAMESIVPVVRHWGEDEGFEQKGIKIVFITQTTGFVDKYFGQGSTVFYKPLPIFYADTERGASKKMADRAMEFFRQFNEEEQKRYAWMVTQRFEGPITIAMPTTRTTYREL